MLSGRIRRLEAVSEPRYAVNLVLEFREIAIRNQPVPLFATLRGVDKVPKLEHLDRFVNNSPTSRRYFPVHSNGDAMFYTDHRAHPPGMGTIVFFGQSFRVEPGMQMRWRTDQPLPPAPAQKTSDQ